MGIDDDATNVDLNTVDLAHTVVDLNDADRPAELASGKNPNYETKRTTDGGASEERVYQVNGWLRFWRYEQATKPNDSNDGDFHVVITQDNDSLYNDTKGQKPTGQSIVVEFPSAACVSGRRNQYRTLGKSHFITPDASDNALDMVVARTKFEALVRNTVKEERDAKCTIKLCSIPSDYAKCVVVSGVGFYDFDHGQTGRSTHTLELHPVLRIVAGTPSKDAQGKLICAP